MQSHSPARATSVWNPITVHVFFLLNLSRLFHAPIFYSRVFLFCRLFLITAYVNTRDTFLLQKKKPPRTTNIDFFPFLPANNTTNKTLEMAVRGRKRLFKQLKLFSFECACPDSIIQRANAAAAFADAKCNVKRQHQALLRLSRINRDSREVHCSFALESAKIFILRTTTTVGADRQQQQSMFYVYNVS